LQTIHHQFNSK